MNYFRFGNRDLLWAMVVLGLVVGWWIEHGAMQAKEADRQARERERDLLLRLYERHHNKMAQMLDESRPGWDTLFDSGIYEE